MFILGKGGQHGEGLPAQETLSEATDDGGHSRAAGCQRRPLQRGEDQQRLQQREDDLCCQQGAGDHSPVPYKSRQFGVSF